jgi:hypothetical protein
MTIKESFSDSTGLEFKDNIDVILFILMNIMASPFLLIVFVLLYQLIGFIIYLITFIVLYKVWKIYGKHPGKLSFSPSFTFKKKNGI